MFENLKVKKESELIPVELIRRIEQEKNAKFVCEACIRNGDGSWLNAPAAIFVCPEPHSVSGSRYFAVINSYLWGQRGGTLVYTNGQSAVDQSIHGVVAKNGDVIYSRYRHDFRKSEDGSVCIDGGRDYTKRVLIDGYEGKSVQLRIVDDQLVVTGEIKSEIEDEIVEDSSELSLCDRFKKFNDEYRKFDRVVNKRSQRPDLHAFLLLDELSSGTDEMIEGAKHDKIWLKSDVAPDLTDQQIVELIRCGVQYSDDSFWMYV